MTARNLFILRSVLQLCTVFCNIQYRLSIDLNGTRPGESDVDLVSGDHLCHVCKLDMGPLKYPRKILE